MSEIDEWVSAEFANLAQVINDYDNYLFLEMVPVADQQYLTDKSKVFRIVDTRKNQIVMYADSLANPTAILTRLWSMDNGKHSVVRELDAHNAAVEALNLKRKIDERESEKDFAAFVFKNTKSRWVHNSRVRDDEFRDLGPVRTHIT